MTSPQIHAKFLAMEAARPLTDREYEIALLLASDMQLKEIADKLSITLKTVEMHRNNIYQKLNLHTRIRLAHWAIGHGFIKPITDWKTV